MKRQYPCIQQSVFKFVLPSFSCTGRAEKQEQDILMRFASLKIAETKMVRGQENMRYEGLEEQGLFSLKGKQLLYQAA